MNVRIWLSSGIFLWITLFVVTGCTAYHPVNSVSKNTSQISAGINAMDGNKSPTDNPQPRWTSIHDVVLAETSLPGYSGDELELIDVNGKYAKNPIVGPFKGDNWTWQFQLRVIGPTGKVFSKLNLPSNQYALFMGKFQFHFADYNGDGYSDFTLGQRAGSNGDWYQLFTVEPIGLTTLKITPTAPIFVSDFTYSPLFQKVSSNGFKVKYYDNAKAKWFQATYLWENGEFQLSGVVPVNG